MSYLENITEFNGIKIKSDQKKGSFDKTATFTFSTLTQAQINNVQNTYPYTADNGSVSTVLEGTTIFNLDTKTLQYYTGGKWKIISSSEIVIDMTPVGVISMFGAETLPNNGLWKECNGESLLRSDYPELFGVIGTTWGSTGATSFNIPDLRGLFVRGWANGSNNDPDVATRDESNLGSAVGDHVGSKQSDAFANHSHSFDYNTRGYSNIGGALAIMNFTNGTSNENTSNFGGNETRPKNVYVMYIIKVK